MAKLIRAALAGALLAAVVAIAWNSTSSFASAQEAGAAGTVAPAAAAPDQMTIFGLLRRGGPLMWPLLAISIFVITLAIERAISLRRQRIFPTGLIDELGRQSELAGGFDPRQVFRITQNYPSSASRILRSMLLKVGRPLGEIEHGVSEAVQRESNRLQYPVSWLSLSAAVAPLIGLLGTVQGITQAFYQFTQLSANQNPGNALAEGIYTALVTTLAGLSIAIPATILAHYFDSRIVRQLNDVDEMIASLLPQIERYEGRLRFAPPNERGNTGRREPAVPDTSNPPASTH